MGWQAHSNPKPDFSRFATEGPENESVRAAWFALALMSYCYTNSPVALLQCFASMFQCLKPFLKGYAHVI